MADLEVFSVFFFFKFSILLLHMQRLLVLGRKDMQYVRVIFRLADVNSSALYPLG